MEESLIYSKLNYWIFICMMMLGLWAMLSKKNLIKKVMGMSIFQSAVILFYVSIAAKHQGTDIPIYPHDLIHPEHAEHHAIEEHTDHHELDTANIHQAELHHKEEKKQHNDHNGHAKKNYISDKINPDNFDNPLPHVLMLTAIVVGVATLGVALSLIQRIYRMYGTIEENEVLEAIAKEPAEVVNPDNAGTHA